MVEWEQMEMESPCVRCFFHNKKEDECIAPSKDLIYCDLGLATYDKYNKTMEETNEVSEL